MFIDEYNKVNRKLQELGQRWAKDEIGLPELVAKCNEMQGVLFHEDMWRLKQKQADRDIYERENE